MPFEERETGKRPLSEAEIRDLIGPRDHIPFLSPRNQLFRERNMKEHPPARDEATRLMAENPNLLRRPLLQVGDEFVFGYNEDEYRRLLSG